MSISLTDFVDFVGKTGTRRLTHVRAIKARGDYEPAEDFWRRLRNGIVAFHKTGQSDKRALTDLGTMLTDPRKRRNYPNAIAGYKKFLGKKRIQWFEPPTALWQEGPLAIRVNPELGLVIDDTRHIVKLYFKATPLAKNKADMILLLMAASLFDVRDGDMFAILDVQRSKVFSEDEPSDALMPLLKGEAASFRTIWDGLS